MSRDSIRRAVSWCVAASCFLLAVVSSFADSISYTYDDLNRLKTIQYGDGTFVEYAYDEVGNRTQRVVTLPPIGSIVVNANAVITVTPSVTLSLTCNDSSKCTQVQFSNDGASWSTPETYLSAKPWTLASGDGTKTVYLKFKDNAGTWSGVYSDNIFLDTTGPTGTIAINGGAAATNSTAVTLNLTCSDTNGCAQMQFSSDNVNWSAAEAYAATRSGTLGSGAGTKTVYAKFKDSAGNWSAAVSDTIALDIAAPTGALAINAGAAATNSTAATLNLTCSDVNGCAQMQFSNDNSTWSTAETYAATKSWTLTSGAGTKTVYAKFKDTAGNWTTAVSDTIALDTTLPTGTLAINAGAAATNSTAATLNLTCSDTNGCAQMQFSNDNTTWSAAETNAATKSWALISGTGIKTVYVKFKDNAGNWSAAVSDTIVLDSSVPITTANPSGGPYNTTKSVVLSCTDGTGSGCDKIHYTINGATPTTASSVYSTPISISATTTLKYFSKDKVGNIEAVKSETYTIETVAPSGTIVINSGLLFTNNTAANLTLTCSDASGCSQMQFSNDNSTWSNAEPYVTTKSWILTAGDGIKTVYVRFKDSAGNWSATLSDYIHLDTVAPTTTVTPDSGVYSDSVVVSLYGGGVTYFTLDGSTPTTASSVYVSPLIITNSTQLKYFSKDSAGNIEAVKYKNYTIIESPAINFSSTTINGQDYFEILYDRINSQDYDFVNTQSIIFEGFTFSQQSTFECMPNILFTVDGNSKITVSCGGSNASANTVNALVAKSGDTTLYYDGYMKGNGNKLEFYRNGILIGMLEFTKTIQ